MRILNRALEIAKAAYPDNFEGKQRSLHWSFLFDKNKLLVMAENGPLKRTHPRNRFNSPFIDKGRCSELNLFLKAKSKLDNPNWKKLILINVRIDRQGNVSYSHPCPACRNLLRYLEMNPRNVFFTGRDGNFQRMVNF